MAARRRTAPKITDENNGVVTRASRKAAIDARNALQDSNAQNRDPFQPIKNLNSIANTKKSSKILADVQSEVQLVQTAKTRRKSKHDLPEEVPENRTAKRAKREHHHHHHNHNQLTENPSVSQSSASSSTNDSLPVEPAVAYSSHTSHRVPSKLAAPTSSLDPFAETSAPAFRAISHAHTVESTKAPPVDVSRVPSAIEATAPSEILTATSVAPVQSHAWDDLDAEDDDDPMMVSEYVDDIYKYFYSMQSKYQVDNPDFLSSNSTITKETRAVLVDWLCEVHSKFRLLPETLFLAVNVADRYTAAVKFPLESYQLVGVASLLVAAKYEEIFCPSINNFIYVCDFGYTREQVIDMERSILSALNFDLATPNPMNFLRRISKADRYDIQTRTFGKYLLEMMLFIHELIPEKPHIIAAAAMYLSRKILGKSPAWNENLAHYSGDVSKAELMPIVVKMRKYLEMPVKHQFFFKKYASKKFLKVSLIARQWAKQNPLEDC